MSTTSLGCETEGTRRAYRRHGTLSCSGVTRPPQGFSEAAEKATEPVCSSNSAALPQIDL